MARGGYRKPANPAPVSGPGALSARTDGQPIREVPGQDYGERQAGAMQQAAAPMAAPGTMPPSPPGGGGRPGPQSAPLASGDAFRPSERPGEPITTGVPIGPGSNGDPVLPPDPNLAIRALYRQFQTQGLLELLQLGGEA